LVRSHARTANEDHCGREHACREIGFHSREIVTLAASQQYWLQPMSISARIGSSISWPVEDGQLALFGPRSGSSFRSGKEVLLRVRAFLTLCLAPGVFGAAVVVAKPQEQSCRTPEGWSTVAARRTRYVIFGEMHGTREGPAFIGTLACALAAKHERLLVAVEHRATDDAALQRAWAVSPAAFPSALQAMHWAGRQDGVASEAMLALLVRLHNLKAKGRRIDVVAFSGDRDEAQRLRFAKLPGQGPHEAAQAENIRRAAEAKPYDHVLVLVGNAHARKQMIERGGVTYEPMAMALGPPGAVTSLNMASAPGTMWNCLLKPGTTLEAGKAPPAGAIDCGSHPAGGVPDLHRPAFIGLGGIGGSRDDAYDGFFWVGPATASPPAVPAP
jgi:hypothetical protein